MIWAQIKNYIIKRNVTFEFAKMKILFYKAVNAVTKGNWINCVEHVNTKVENKFQKLNYIIERTIKRFIRNINNSDISLKENTESTSE